jgi:hypothetical protein
MKKFFFYLMLFLFVAVTGCKEDDEDQCCVPTNPECANYDPCLGKIETTADFTILIPYAQAGVNAGTYFEDSVTFGATMRFVAKDTAADSYRWILGVDTIYDEIEVTRSAFSLPVGSYPVDLRVTKDSDSLCFPLDDGIDQNTRFFTKISGCDAAIWGEYRGVFENEFSDSLSVSMVVSSSDNSIEPCDPQSTTSAVFGINIFGEGDTTRLFGNGRVNTRYSFTIGSSSTSNVGEAILDLETGVVEIIYTVEGENRIFNGIKL